MREITMIYCGEDGEAGKALANSIRKESEMNKVMLGDAGTFDGPATDAVKVIIMPDVPEWRAQTIREAYPANIIMEDDKTKADCVARFDNALAFVPVPDETITITAQPKKRGWPKGKSRKKAAA